jgi:hypothetical protein
MIRYILITSLVAFSLFGISCTKDCEITCVTAVHSVDTAYLSSDSETLELDVENDQEGRTKCIDEAESRNVSNTTACWGYYD